MESCSAGWAGAQIEGGRWCCGLARVEWIGKVEAGWVAEETEEDLGCAAAASEGIDGTAVRDFRLGRFI